MTSDPSLPDLENLSARSPFGGKRRLFNVARVRFKANFLTHLYDAQMLELRKGDLVIADTSRGPALATLTEEIHREIHPRNQLKKILRKATERDLRALADNERREREAFSAALLCIRERRLPMKLVQVHCMHDNSRMVFYFSSDARIDFRVLVRDLAHKLRTRIEMRQIGARDGARMIGGIGPCGRELCCSTFLEKFGPVSIRMAKDQGMTLNPRKVSGMCGRLMCCLVYEQQIYHRARRRLPRIGKPVSTAEGMGTIRTVDVLQEKVGVALHDGQFLEFPLREVLVLTAQDLEQRRAADEPEEEDEDTLRAALLEVADGEDQYLWDDDLPPDHADTDADADAPPAPRKPPTERPAPRADRPPRPDAQPRPPRPEGDNRPPRPEGDNRPPRPEGDNRPPRPRGDRPPRPEGAPSDAPPRRDRRPRLDPPATADAPPRRDRPPRLEGEPRQPRPPRPEGAPRPPRPEGEPRQPRPRPPQTAEGAPTEDAPRDPNRRRRRRRKPTDSSPQE